MKLKRINRKMRKGHEKILRKLTGQHDTELTPFTFECGPYVIYDLIEQQMAWVGGINLSFDDNGNPTGADFMLPKFHTYIFLGAELIANMTFDNTSIMSHIFRPHLQMLQQAIPFDVLDVTDVWRTVNPYWALWQFSEDDDPEKEDYYNKMFERMDALRKAGENRPVVYIESAYVREDCRGNGIFHMYVDHIKNELPGCIIWLNMEPTSGAEMESEYRCVPSYTVSELGQLNLNASIAEKTGFKVDPDTWHRTAETTDADGNITTETILVRKCAYYMPDEIRTILKDDGDLVALGRAKQKVMHEKAQSDKTRGSGIIDMNSYEKDGYRFQEWRESSTDEGVKCWYAGYNAETGAWVFGVSHRSPADYGLDNSPIESYEFLDDALESEHIDMWTMLLQMLVSATGIDPLGFNDDEDFDDED